MRSYHSVGTGNVGFFPGQGMRRIHNDSTRGSSGRASGCGRDRQDLDRTLADGLGVQRTIVRHGVTCIPPRREIYRVNQGRMARNSGFLGKIISTILIAVITPPAHWNQGCPLLPFYYFTVFAAGFAFVAGFAFAAGFTFAFAAGVAFAAGFAFVAGFDFAADFAFAAVFTLASG